MAKRYELSNSEWERIADFFPYPKQDVLQNGIIEQCSMQLCGLSAVVLHGKTISSSPKCLQWILQMAR